MTILCIADHKDSLIYSDQIKSRFNNVTFVLSAGDLELEYYDFITSSLNKPLLFVFGNHKLKNIKYYRREYSDIFTGINILAKTPGSGSIYIGGKVKRTAGLTIAGLGGCMKYNKGKNQFSEAGMFFYMLRLIPGLLWNRIFHKRFLDILVTHAPPRGIHDNPDTCHRGFKTFLLFMNLFKPIYLVHGHIHLYDLNAIRSTLYNKTTVINAYEHTIIEMES